MEQLPDKVRAAIDDGRKLEAIRELRKLTGMNLSDAKAAVDAAAQDKSVSSAASASVRVLSALDEGRTLDAIRLLRDDAGISLREAKLRVDTMMEQRGIQPAKPDFALLAVVAILIALSVYWLVG